MAEQGSENDAAAKPKRPKWRVALIVTLALVGVLVLAYAAGAIVFSQLYYPNTTVMGLDLSLQTRDDAAAQLDDVVESYALSVSADEFAWSCEADDVALIVNTTQVAEELLAANEPLVWPVRLANALIDPQSGAYAPDEDAGYPVTYDEDALLASLQEAVDAYNEQRSGAFDVASAYDEDEGLCTVEMLRANQHLDTEAIAASVALAFSNLVDALELDESAYELVADGASDEELQAACDDANTMLAADLSLTMGGSEVATLDSSTVSTWLSFADDLSATLDADGLSSWADELAESLCTVGTTRTFTGSAGDEVTIGGGTYGWEVDADELASTVQEAIAAGQTGELEVPTTTQGAVYTGAGEADWGAYAEVDISEQHAWYYDADGNLLWESGVITGNPNKGNDTPTGVYKVNAKYTNITLRGGYDSDTGEYGWETPVTYWMAFVGSSVGFHDATWQASSSFSNPKAYLSVGSHGCVNLPKSAASELYDIIEVGDCVIVHE